MPGPAPESTYLALSAWNMMGGLDWQALPVVCDVLGVADPESLINQLVVMRDHHGRS
ncbi:MAG: hypothetical protein GY942_03625 [Aestuariibacter sp.]|nr:hypothetical protein [Aestuariibacter sp.]